jgi:hypothetical protein
MARLEIEHIIPLSEGGNNAETNLWLACPLCNRDKSNRTLAVDPETGETVPLFNPRTQSWSDHFRWSDDSIRIVGRTAVGRATVATLHLSDDPDALAVRSYWVLVGWHPPEYSDVEHGAGDQEAHEQPGGIAHRGDNGALTTAGLMPRRSARIGTIDLTKDASVQLAGQSSGLIREITSAREVINDVVEEAVGVLDRLTAVPV